jgi:enoyl-CoA hydratase/carnithine racemase
MEEDPCCCQQFQLTRYNNNHNNNDMDDHDTKNKNIFVLTMTGKPHPANVFSMDMLRRLDQLLDQVEDHLFSSAVTTAATTTTTTSALAATALIITGNGKFFSAGFHLQALTGQSHRKATTSNNNNMPRPSQDQQQQQQQKLVEYSWKILARLLVFPVPTIAFVNGHAFGLGLFLALACDYRIMEKLTPLSTPPLTPPPSNETTNETVQQQPLLLLPKKNLLLCLPEITIGLPLGSGFAALAKCKLPSDTLRTAALTGKQYRPDEALSAKIIDAMVVIPSTSTTSTSTTTNTPNTFPPIPQIPAAVLSKAIKLAPTSEKGNLAAIKMELYGDTYQALINGKSRAKL